MTGSPVDNTGEGLFDGQHVRGSAILFSKQVEKGFLKAVDSLDIKGGVIDIALLGQEGEEEAQGRDPLHVLARLGQHDLAQDKIEKELIETAGIGVAENIGAAVVIDEVNKEFGLKGEVVGHFFTNPFGHQPVPKHLAEILSHRLILFFPRFSHSL